LRTLLLDACLEGDLELVKTCIEDGVDINTRNEEGLTALHTCSCNGHAAIAKYLVEHNANINAVDDDSWTPLHGAACFGEIAVTRYLVVHGANLMAVNDNGDTPFAVAVEENTKRYLLECMRKLKTSSILYALHDYEKQEQDELGVKRGEKLTITTSASDRENELWWFAINQSGDSGLIPSNYLGEYSPIQPIQS